MKIAITGHRPNKLGNDYDLASPLIEKIDMAICAILLKQDELYPLGSIELISGMALGIDTLFAKIAIRLGYKFTAAIPCQQQYKMWPQKAKELYLDIINHPLCTKYYVSEGPYSPQKMQLRNQWMVDNCDMLIAVWDGTLGGTSNCVKYAQQQQIDIRIINPKDLNL